MPDFLLKMRRVKVTEQIGQCPVTDFHVFFTQVVGRQPIPGRFETRRFGRV